MQAAAVAPLFTSVVNVFELERGAGSPDALLQIRAFLGFFTLLGLDLESAREAAAIDATLKRNGLRLDARDTLIAGTALAHGMELVTRNRRHFERVPGLVLSDL